MKKHTQYRELYNDLKNGKSLIQMYLEVKNELNNKNVEIERLHGKKS